MHFGERVGTVSKNWVHLVFLLVSLLLTPLQRVIAQPAEDDEAILYMSYESGAAGTLLIVSPEGYRVVALENDGTDSSRYLREQMVASEDGRWLAISVRDTVDDVILWVPILALDDEGGNSFVPLPITRAVRLGSFSPDGRYLALAVVGQEGEDAPLTGGVMVFDVTGDPEGDEQIKWWLPLEPRQGQVMWAEIGDWTPDGIQFLPACYDCDDAPTGEYALWNPFADIVTPQTGVFYASGLTVIESTGEALRLDYDEGFPRDSGVTAANVIRYVPTISSDTAAMTTIYADPRGIDWTQWVLDGQAVLAQTAGVNDAWVLIYRDGRVVDYPHALGVRFIVGSTEGWFVESGNADGYTDITHIRLDGSDYLVSAGGGATVIRPPHLGSDLTDPPPFPPVAP